MRTKCECTRAAARAHISSQLLARFAGNIAICAILLNRTCSWQPSAVRTPSGDISGSNAVLRTAGAVAAAVPPTPNEGHPTHALYCSDPPKCLLSRCDSQAVHCKCQCECRASHRRMMRKTKVEQRPNDAMTLPLLVNVQELSACVSAGQKSPGSIAAECSSGERRRHALRRRARLQICAAEIVLVLHRSWPLQVC